MNNVSLEKLKDIVNPSLLLSSLGFHIYCDNQDEIRAPCAIHGGDNKTAFCFRKSSKRFYCFTHSCEEDEGGEINNDIVSLVMKVKRCSFIEAVRFLSDITGFDVDFGSVNTVEENRLNKLRDKSKFVKGILSNKSILPDLSEDVVKSYISAGALFFHTLGLPEDIIKQFELGTTVDDYGITRGTIPIRDENGRLVSISGRRVDGDEEPRYLLVKDFQKRKVLYNLFSARKFRDKYEGKIIVVEGFKALWHVVRAGFPNVVAVMGKVIKPEQRNLLVKCGFGCSILLLDGDNAGRDGMEKSQLILKGKMDVVPIYLPQGLSPDDISLDELSFLLSSFL